MLQRRGTSRVLLLGAVLVLAAGCAQTELAKLTGSPHCALLGSVDCAKLTPGSGEQANLRYVNPQADWSRYNEVLIDPVTLWSGAASSASVTDQKALVTFFYNALRDSIGKSFTLTEKEGPRVMRLQVAITDLAAATPVLRTISMVVPQARALTTLKYAVTGQYAFAGGVQVEAKVTDSTSGALLAEAVERRVGGGAIDAAVQWQWGDAEDAMRKMADVAADRLQQWTSGSARVR